MQVRLNLESEGHSVKVIGLTGAGGQIADFPEVLVDFLTFPRGLAPRALISQPLHRVDLHEFAPDVRDLRVQAHGVSGWGVLLNPSDSAGRVPDGLPTLVQLEAFWHLTSSQG